MQPKNSKKNPNNAKIKEKVKNKSREAILLHNLCSLGSFRLKLSYIEA